MCVVFLSIDIYNSRLVSDNKELNTESKQEKEIERDRKRERKKQNYVCFFV